MHPFEFCFLLIACLFLIGSLDDLLIDAVHLLNGLSPEKIPPLRWQYWRSMEQKGIAVMIPAWREAAVLEAMVTTNLSRIRYNNYKWFIGVYPNDVETCEIAACLQNRYPDNVVVVITDRPGPTSKAHCLNCILSHISENAGRLRGGWQPAYLAIHDAEDVIHPDCFTAINGQSIDLDFIQVPIFSLPVPVTKWVAGTYLDEFAEIHLKEIPVRQVLNMPIPSAGVGTFFSWRVLNLMGRRFGYWFDEGNLTEDYEISLRIARIGGKQRFLLMLDERAEIVATREYFPEELGRSIRQKTRWTTGIGLQTSAKWGNFGIFAGRFSLKNAATAYALWRDRKAIWANPSVLAAWLLMALTCVVHTNLFSASAFSHLQLLRSLFIVNMALFTIRLYQRARFSEMIYGRAHGALAIPRVLLSTVINGAACLRALRQYYLAAASKLQTKIVWDKTDHKFPDLATINHKTEPNASTRRAG
jgi:adsorption protein B